MLSEDIEFFPTEPVSDRIIGRVVNKKIIATFNQAYKDGTLLIAYGTGWQIAETREYPNAVEYLLIVAQTDMPDEDQRLH